MGTQTMGSNGGAGKSMLDGLSRQGSLYNLTLDEVQQQLGDLGKPFNSMNLDELLKSVCTAEANHGMSSNAPGLAQLDSGVTKKTVDEVWQDIQQGQKKKKNVSDDDNGNGNDDNISKGDGERQPTLGEMTLEDFLVKAGIVAESSPGKRIQERDLENKETQWMGNYQAPVIPQQNVVMAGRYQVQQPLMDVGYMSPTSLMSGLSDRHLSGRKRYASGDVMEKTVERRQKRMIKNRESAARSRARKQAYTHELENKVSRLEEENERLRREKEVEKVIPWVPPAKPKHQLRRTSSAPL
ncbi:ABSCISIC ACID-INSENSITIVE 5-like protein 2 [Bidens hawaiensis]|uniref:ABSCISIC ACID-INSENSITIVE 5-like protein 2 n=1 Tax=Bidens hawaiensis TaxID=980011 RepID=UPI004049C74D